MRNFIVSYKFAPGKRDVFMKAIVDNKIGELSNAEHGCLRYQYLLPADDPELLVLIEGWETEDDRQAHMKSEHYLKLQEIKKELVLEWKLEEYQLI